LRKILLPLVPLLLLVAPPVKAANDELIIGPDGALDAIVNGKPAHMLFRGVGSSTAILNPSSAERFGLKTGIIKFPIQYRVGPNRINGKSGVTRYTVGGRAIKRRVGWFERDVAPGFDGLLGPMAIDYPIVTQRLRPSVAGERDIIFNMGSLGYSGVGVFFRAKPFTYLIFDPTAPTTIINAPFANELARILRGHFEGTVHDRVVAFGVSRPVRNIEFGTPLMLGVSPLSIPLHRADVRTLPGEATDAIPEQEPDPDEIIVVAPGQVDNRPRYIVVGADALRNCSSITFDKRKRQIRLSCVPADRV
jgi:hypothetical protein